MGYIGAHGAAALHRYKYSGEDHSYLAKYLLNPFWTRFVKVFPLWMPPNMITLMGFMFLVTSSLLGYIYSPQLDSPPPRWVHFAHGLLLFLYQTFDAVDGKQARRTNSSSPLGELFDHGCDALACAFEAMAFGSTAMCGRDTFWFWVISAVPFYGATWEHYFTNTLILPVINGPTEGLALIYVSHLFTALVGAEWWAQQLGESIPLFSWVPFVNAIQTSRAVLYMMIAFAVIPTVAINVSNVYKVVQSRKGSMVLALAMLYPFVVLLGGVLIWDSLSPINLIETYPHLVVLGTGLAFGFLVGRMILAHLCDEPKGLKTNMCMSLVYLPFALANALTARLNNGVPLVDELWVLLGYCIFTVSLYLHFATSVIHEITAALGIYCFRIKAIWWRGVRSAAEAANLPAAYSFGRSIRCLHQYETIQAIPREATGRRVSARDRTIGRIPAVVFTQSLLETDASKRGVSRKQLLTADRKQIKSIVDSVGLPFFCSTTFKLQVRAGQGSSSLVESGRVLPLKIHRDEESGKILNLVFVWANDGELLKVDVPIVFKGLDDCPGLKKGGNLRSMRSTLKLLGPAEHIPSKIEVDVSKLDIADKVLMQEVEFHPSLKLLSKNETLPVCKIVATSPVKEPEAVQA